MARPRKQRLFGVGIGAGLVGAMALALKYALRPRGKAPLPDSISPAVFATKVLHTSHGHVIYHEAGSGRPLLFIHSLCLGGSSYEWSKVYPEFAERYQVLAPDLIGFGESQRPNVALSSSDYVRVLAEFIRGTCGLEMPTIVASGLGAGFAVQLAAQHPELVHRLILHMPTGGNDFGLARLRWSTRLAAHAEGLQRFMYRNYQSTPDAVRNWLANGGFVDASKLSEETVDVFTTCAQLGGAENAIRNFHAGRMNLDLEGRLRSVSHPVTFLWGSEPGQPSLEAAQRLRAQVPSSPLVVIPRVGALAALEDPQAMIAVLNEQLEPGLRVFGE
jgi:pimeloyl-ACP methyl ester carboxylesterase